jgi:hypothetical protein
MRGALLTERSFFWSGQFASQSPPLLTELSTDAAAATAAKHEEYSQHGYSVSQPCRTSTRN